MKRTNKSIKTISIFLCILMAFLLPVQVCADVTGNEEEELTADFSNISSDGEEVGNIVSEITGERTEYSKTFLLDDGTKMLAEYPEPIHFKNDNNKWIEYNNTLVETVEKATSDEITNECDYTNKKSDIDITLSSSTNSDNLIMLSDDKYKISWGYKNVDDSDINIITQDNATTGNDKFTNLENLSAEAEYEEVFDNIDLQYKVSSTGVKENIILNNSDSQNEFEIIYDIDKLIPNQIDDNTIILYDGNKKVYKIDAPYMVDSKGVSSKKLKLEIISNKNGKLHIKLIADKAFINDNSRSYPIIIDPEISYINNSNVFTYTGIVGNNLSSYPPYYLSSNAYSNWKINSLPVLDNSQVIIKATATFSIGSITGAVSNDNPIVVNLYDGKTTSPYYDTQVEDYCAISSASDKLEFDFTRLLKNWMNGSTNHGFVIKSNNIGNRILNISYGETIRTEEETRYINYPMYTIVYKDFAGTEDSMSYHTVSAGSKARVSVNDYLGNLVVSQNLYESKAARMPISLSATYNSFDYNTNYSDSMIGNGWKFSFNQYIRTTNAGYDYVYIDEDRTKHYLKETSSGSNKWEDEEDLGLTLKFKDGFGLLNDGSQTKKFRMPSEGGYLMYIYENDKPNNHIGYGRASDGVINEIYDSTDSLVASFTTTTISNKKYISKINLLGSVTIDFSYTQLGNKVLLTKVKQSDGTCSLYTYDSHGKLTQVRFSNESNSTVMYGGAVSVTYNSKKQISSITEKGTDSSAGNYLNLVYGDDNTTTVTDRKNRTETYTFDNEGNRISTLNANGFISHGDSSGLSISGGSDSFTKNYIEEPYSFDNSYYSGSYQVEPTIKYFGSNSIKLSSSDNTQIKTVEHTFADGTFSNENVTLSAYVKTNNINNDTNTDTIYGALISLKYTTSNLKEEKSIPLTGTQDWQRISTTLRIPSDATDVTVSLKLEYASGDAYFDCIQLEKGTSANDFNAIKNSDFSNNSNWFKKNNQSIVVSNNSTTILGNAGQTISTDTNGYYFSNLVSTYEDDEEYEEYTGPTSVAIVQETVPNGYVSEYDDYGHEIKSEQGVVNQTVKKYYKETNSSSDTSNTDSENTNTSTTEENHTNYINNQYIFQNIPVGRSGISFKISGEAAGNSVPITNKLRTFGIALNIYYANESVPESHYQEFNQYTDSRQSVSMTVVPDRPETEINYIAFAFVYGYNENDMIAYNAMVNISPVSRTSNSSNTLEEESSEDDNLLDEEVVSESVDKTTDYIQTGSSYTDDGNYLSSETDEFGNTTEYTNDINGNITCVEDGNNNKTRYTYDSSGNVQLAKGKKDETSALQDDYVTTGYSYGYTGNLSSITHNDFTYNYNYNVFSQLLSTKVGNTSITTNTYNPNNGLLSTTTYGNGAKFSYYYDDYDNVTTIMKTSMPLVQFTYNKKGLISKCVDFESGDTTYYYYDYNGEIQNQYTQGSNGHLQKYISYDESGALVEKDSVFGTVRTITNGIDQAGNSYVDVDGIRNSSTKDDFGRTQSSAVTYGTEANVVTEYEYVTDSETHRTSNTISKITQKLNSQVVAEYEYSYDGVGNITEIKENGTLVHKYVYDSVNQLKEEYNYAERFYVNYSYDNAGNILSTNRQSLNSSNQPYGSPYGNTYYYNNTNWKDVLTRFNSNQISYDAIGNPLTYYNGMSFTWKNGRWLARTTLSDNTGVTYQYNYTGIRTKKTVGGVATNYYYDSNNNLIGLKSGTDVAYFYYDTDNSPISMKYDNRMYYYVKNLQGDIVKILDSNGSTVASYTYDSWGNITDSTVNNSTVANMSPFRYRGYVYDIDTGLYYLQSRYYDPQTGRFLNADDTAYIGATGTVLSTNLFTYCENDPVNNIDYDGNLKISLSKYKNKSWIIKLVAKYLPNITKDIYGKTIFNKSILGIRLEINVAYGYQTNSKKVLGMAMSKKGIELSGSVSIGGNRSFSGGLGFDWGGLYLKFAIGYNVGNHIYCAVGLKLSVSYFTALAIAACCVAMPYVSTFISSTIAAASASIKTLGGIMASMAPKFIYCFI